MGLKVRRPRSAKHLAKDVRCAIFVKYLWIIVRVNHVTSENHVIYVN